MKKQTVDVSLILEDEQEYATVKGINRKTEPKVLIEYIRRGIKSKTITNGMKIRDGQYTKYVYEVNMYNDKKGENEISSLVVRLKNSEKSYHFATMKSLEDMIQVSLEIKKKNVNRVIAGIAAGLFIIVATGPTLAKGIKVLSEKDYAAQMQTYNGNKQTSIANVTEEQKQKSVNDYYSDLKAKAEAGDKEAIEEYARYILEQQLAEEAEVEHSKTR